MKSNYIFFSIIIILFISNIAISQNSGSLLWDNQFEGSESEIINDIKQTSDGGYICVGSTTTYGPYIGTKSLYLVKTNSAGTEIWTKTFEQDGDYKEEGMSIQITPDGGYIISGATYEQGPFNSDAWIIRCNSAGDIIWEDTYNGNTGNEYGTSVLIDDNGDYVVCGSSVSSGIPQFDVLLLKYTPSGTLLWNRIYGNGNKDIGMDIKQMANGNYVIVGTSIPTQEINDDIYLIKTYPNGTPYWEIRIGDNVTQRGYAIDLFDNGDFAIAGSKGQSEYDKDIWVLRLDTIGDIIWEQTFDDGNDDFVNDIVVTTNGGVAVTGVLNSDMQNAKSLVLLKYNADGDFEWSNEYNDNQFMGGFGNNIMQNESGNLIVGGYKTNSYNDEGWILCFKGDNQPPETFGLLEPANDSTIASIHEPVEFIWESAIDPEGDNITYELHIFNSSDDTIVQCFMNTSYLFDGSNFFENNSDYSWSVYASDGEYSTQSNIFVFHTSNYAAPSKLTAIPSNTYINLSWFTPVLNIRDLLGYNIYHSFDDGNFIYFDYTTDTIYNHQDPEMGTNAYYITAVYDDGESEASNIAEVIFTGIKKISENKIEIYPNPVKSALSIIIDEPNYKQPSEIRITNLVGKTVVSLPFNNTIDVSTLKDGIYFISILDDNEEEITTKKLIKH